MASPKNQNNFSTAPHEAHHTSRRIIKSFEARMNMDRTMVERFADFLTKKFGSMIFLSTNAVWFTIWILINTGLVSFIPAFDPFPFNLLTMVVSLQAIILAIVVLISQNRAGVVDDLRQELDLQVDIITEQEITKLLKLVTKIAEKNGVKLTEDNELQSMLKTTNFSRIEHSLEKQYGGKSPLAKKA